MQFAFGADGLVFSELHVGRNLQTSGTIKLAQPAPASGLEIVIETEDPARLLLAKEPQTAGAASITLKVRPHTQETPEFWVQGFADEGTVRLTAKESMLGEFTGSVSLSPSAILITGPYHAPTFRVTPRSSATRLTVYSMRLDSSLKPVEQQAVAGGVPVSVEIQSSDELVGAVDPSSATIEAGAGIATTDFRPRGVGSTSISVVTPAGFTRLLENASLGATVAVPGIALMDECAIGNNLQIQSAIGLGEPAPEPGIDVEITSSDPSKLRLAKSADEAGEASISVHIPGGGVSAKFFLQAFAESGKTTYTAIAPGYQPRTAPVIFVPSGVVIMNRPYGPPDEAELLRPHAKSVTGEIFTSLSNGKKLELGIWTVALDPVTLRAADITVQPLRAGKPLKVSVESSHPEIGKVISPVTIAPGTEFGATEFTPLGVGTTVLSVVLPTGLTKPSNSTSVTAIVRE